MRVDIITVFPDYFSPLSLSLIGKAAQRGDIRFRVHDLRSWTHDVHRTVDDVPFGGGPGMVMKPEPWGDALDAIVASAAAESAATGGPVGPGTLGVAAGSEAGGAGREQAAGSEAGSAGEAKNSHVAGAGPRAGLTAGTGAATAPVLIVPTPSGELFTQAVAAELARAGHLVFACGRYEGIDARVTAEARRRMPAREISIGDYVLAGGESAALVMVEAICRLLPGVLGNAESAADDSFGAGSGEMAGLVEGPAYTRPRSWRGLDVPDILLSGDHQAVARWRRDEALRRTARNRPDLAARLPDGALDVRDRQVLSEAGFAVTDEDVAH